MKAVVVTKLGGAEVLHIRDLPEPHPGQHQTRIRVHAAGVNPTDAVVRQTGGRAGLPSEDNPIIPGMDLAGVIDEAGVDSTWAIGDQVFAVTVPGGPGKGAYAEWAVVDDASVARLPHDVDFVSGCTLGMNGLTARASLDQLALTPGGTIAVTGAAGAYGGYVVQQAKADGLQVVADASPTDTALVQELGADVVVPRGPGLAKRIRGAVPGGVDGLADGAVIDAAALGAIRDNGGLAVVRRWPGPSERGIQIHSTSVGPYLSNTRALERLRQQVEDGLITLRVAQIFTPDQMVQAHRRLAAGGIRGRLVLRFDDVPG